MAKDINYKINNKTYTSKQIDLVLKYIASQFKKYDNDFKITLDTGYLDIWQTVNNGESWFLSSPEDLNNEVLGGIGDIAGTEITIDFNTDEYTIYRETYFDENCRIPALDCEITQGNKKNIDKNLYFKFRSKNYTEINETFNDLSKFSSKFLELLNPNITVRVLDSYAYGYDNEWQDHSYCFIIEKNSKEIFTACCEFDIDKILEKIGQITKNNLDTTSIISDFVDKLQNESNSLVVQSNIDLDKLEDIILNKEPFEFKVVAIDTKETLITITSKYNNNDISFEYIVNIQTDEDTIIYKKNIENHTQLNQAISMTIANLEELQNYYKYSKDLEKFI